MILLLIKLMMAGLVHSKSECQQSAIRQLQSNLVDVLQHEINVVLQKAWSEAIIGEQVHALAQASGQSDRYKADKFIEVIRDRVKSEPGTFDVLLSILRSFPSLQYLAQALEDKLCPEHRANHPAVYSVGVPSMMSTPKSSTSLQSSDSKSSPDSTLKDEEYHTRIPPRGRKKRPSDNPWPARGCASSVGPRKLETREDTDEESGYQDEESMHGASNQLNTESEKTDGDLYVSRPDEGHISFKAPIEAEPDYIPFSKTADAETDVEGKSGPDDGAAIAGPGVYGQELQHDATSQQQIVGRHGIQTTAEGWADKATFYLNQGAAKEAEMAREIEELRTKIDSMKQQVDANKEGSQKLEQMEEHIHEQEAELDDCKEKLAEKEEELKKLDEQREADIQAAEDKLKKERDVHEQRIARVEEEVRSLQNQLEKKTAEADNLRHSVDDLKKEYEALKITTDAQIQELEQQLDAKKEEAKELKNQYQQLEESGKSEIAQLEQKYKKEISELKELVESQKREARLKQENLEVKFEKEYQVKENQRLKDEHKLVLKINKLEMKLAEKKTQIMQMQKEEQARLHKEATEKIKQQAKEHEEEKEKLKEEMERKLEEQIKLARTESEKRFQDMYEEKVRRLSSVSSTSSSEASLSILRSNTNQSTDGGNKDDMDTITEEAAHLSISKSDKQHKED